MTRSTLVWLGLCVVLLPGHTQGEPKPPPPEQENIEAILATIRSRTKEDNTFFGDVKV